MTTAHTQPETAAFSNTSLHLLLCAMASGEQNTYQADSLKTSVTQNYFGIMSLVPEEMINPLLRGRRHKTSIVYCKFLYVCCVHLYVCRLCINFHDLCASLLGDITLLLTVISCFVICCLFESNNFFPRLLPMTLRSRSIYYQNAANCMTIHFR